MVIYPFRMCGHLVASDSTYHGLCLDVTVDISSIAFVETTLNYVLNGLWEGNVEQEKGGGLRGDFRLNELSHSITAYALYIFSQFEMKNLNNYI